MTIFLRIRFIPLLIGTTIGLPCISAAQSSVQSPASPESLDALRLQELLDHDDYIAFYKQMATINAASLSEAQRQYFFGMAAYHLGHLHTALDPLTYAVNNNKTLSAHQIESGLETLGQDYQKLQRYNDAAAAYNEIDKVFGASLGADDQYIRDNRHLSVLLRPVPPPTSQISGDFTLARTGREYPVSIGGKNLSAQLDTGAEFTVLSESTAKAWGVTMLDGTGRLRGYIGKVFKAQPAYIPVLTIGKAELHNVAVYVTADENLYIPQIKLQTNALLGYPVVAALGRLTFAKDGSLTVSAKSPQRDLHASAALWLGGHSLLAELGTQVVMTGDKVTGGIGTRLFMLDTGSGSTWLTDHYLAEHTNVFHGPPPEMAKLAGAGGMQEIPAYGAHGVPLFAGDTLIMLNGPHILTQPTTGEAENYFGLLGEDVLRQYSSYTIDLRIMTLTVQP